MYIWKTDKLSSEIKENTLSEKNWKDYFLAGTILITLSMYMVQTMPRTNTPSLIAEAILMIVITVIGINAAFNANNGNKGSSFVARITALSFPLSIKIIATSFIFGMILGFLNEMDPISSENEEWAYSVFTILIQILFFWRIKVHLTYINE